MAGEEFERSAIDGVAAGHDGDRNTDAMSRYTLPANTTEETIKFTIPDAQGTQFPLAVKMHFAKTPGTAIRMLGYDPGSPFADGLDIVMPDDALKTLKLVFDPGTTGWIITAKEEKAGAPTHTLSTTPVAFGVPLAAPISIVISAPPVTPGGPRLTSGDPKIKVIRPN